MLTAEGKKFLAVRDRELHAGFKKFLGGLTAAEQETLRELLLRALAHHDPRVRLCLAAESGRRRKQR